MSFLIVQQSHVFEIVVCLSRGLVFFFGFSFRQTYFYIFTSPALCGLLSSSFDCQCFFRSICFFIFFREIGYLPVRFSSHFSKRHLVYPFLWFLNIFLLLFTFLSDSGFFSFSHSASKYSPYVSLLLLSFINKSVHGNRILSLIKSFLPIFRPNHLDTELVEHFFSSRFHCRSWLSVCLSVCYTTSRHTWLLSFGLNFGTQSSLHAFA